AIGRITPVGTITEFRTPGVSGTLNGITLGPDGNMWFTGTPGVDPIGWITTTGTVRTVPLNQIGSANPMSIATGPDGNIWFTDPRSYSRAGYSFDSYIGRLVTPYLPANTEPPLLSGQALEGQVLSVSDGAWTHEPTTFAYQWQRCDTSGENCENISGGNEAQYFLAGADVGHVLRAVVVASNIAGEAPTVSGFTATIRGLPSPPAVVT